MSKNVFHNLGSYAIFKKMSYWHARGGQGFYKFLQPCNHKHYREGDSWCEELNMSEKTFRKHLKSVCTVHQNRQAFHSTEDLFQGKPFACFHDRVAHKTYYFGNAEIIQKYQNSLDQEEGRGAKKFAPAFRVASESIYRNNRKQYTNPPKSPLLNKTKQSQRDEGRLSQKDFEKAESMIAIWKEKTKGNIPVPKLSQHFARKLIKALKEHFDNSLETWCNYCKSIGSSNFLLGKVSGFKAWLVWAIRADAIEKIKKGSYGIVEKFIKNTCCEPRNDFNHVLEKILFLKESRSLKDLRIKILKKIGVDSYVSWFSEISLIEEDGKVTPRGENKFIWMKTQSILRETSCETIPS